MLAMCYTTGYYSYKLTLVTEATVVVFACSVVMETIVDVSVTMTTGVVVEVMVIACV